MTDEEFAKAFPNMTWLLPRREPTPPKPSWSELPGNIAPSAVNTATDLYKVVTMSGDGGDRQPKHSWSEVPRNLVPSAIDQVTGAIDMFMHPEPYVDAVQGTVDRIVPPMVTSFMDTYVSPRSNETRERQGDISKQFIQGMKDRYGGAENIKNTIITDPVGFGLDVGGLALGGIGLIRGVRNIKPRLAGYPTAAERFRQAGQTTAENELSLGNGEKLSAIGKDENTQASKMVTIYNPVPKQQRGFKQDYAHEPLTDKAGNLRKDRDGRWLIAKIIAGRRLKDGPDVPLTTRDIRAIGEEMLRDGIRSVPPRELKGDAGSATFDGKSGMPLSIKLSNKLTPRQAEKVLAHEVAHVIQNFFGGVSIDGIKRELNFIYNALTTGRERTRNLTLPENIGYTAAETPIELLTEAIRAYMADPNWIKTVAPKTAAKIREWVNTHPELSKIIQFNSFGAVITGAALAAGAQDKEANAAGAFPQHNSRGPLARVGSIPIIPFGLTGAAVEVGSYGMNEIAKALSRRAFYPQDLKSKRSGNILQAFVNAKQKPQLHGGPK